ncbi:MAG: retroviral-like aspartic protease family protein [Azonexus sp.]|jgi:aspartyl protease family protein|uniref:retropepsin-like aspartic protease n=1 Tax=Azonexus sp. TaxID=1872668 RepID=UPI0028227458|nr:retropepsin-like aspartic protease [Azonexus sp.]MDR0775508.1 retroviral-like aspartic protease family protein [Azonexus sp.]
MATGSLVSGRGVGRGVQSALLACLLFAAAPLAAQDVGLAGIMGSRAMLIINGGEPEAVRVGESLDGVKVVSIQGDQVVVDIGGRKRPLRVGQHAVGAVPAEGSGKIVLTADGQGHFFTTGTINGTSVRFLVDTGASVIALGASDARRLGLDSSRGQRGYAQTANGQVEVRRVKLDTVSIGGVTLHQVDASILPNDHPVALLGMSFLNRMEMQRDGGTMTLRQRY